MNNNCWTNKYFKKDILSINVDKYINLFNKIEKPINIKDKLLNIEEDYNNKILNYKKNFKHNNFINKFINLTSLEILTKMVDIIKLLSKYSLKNNNLEYNFFINSLKTLLKLSNILKNRLKQPELQHKNYDIKTIPRCSYKFCSYKDSCTYNYNDKEIICYQDHYTHNMVSADLQVLISHIQINYKENYMFPHNKEILKSINTLSYVINHMENELKNKCLYQEKKDWEKFHYTKKIIKNIEKVIKKKTT